MEREVSITVNVRGQTWELTDAFLERDTGFITYDDVRGNCSRYLPKDLLQEIEDAASQVAYKMEAERCVEEAMYRRYDR